MDWFYAINEVKYGPTGPRELADLARNGTLLAEDFVWHEGLERWRPLRLLAGQIYRDASGTDSPGEGDEESLPVETAICAHSLRVLPRSELIPYGRQWVDPRHKEAFLQGLMETGSTARNSGAEDEEEQSEVRYVGFWFRLLSMMIDTFVVIIPAFLCMIPYGIASSMATADPDADGFSGEMTTAMILTYAFGLLSSHAIVATYHTWMVGKHRATLGKMAIGAVVVAPDGKTISYRRAFCRWLCWTVLNNLIFTAVIGGALLIGALIMGGIAGLSGGENPGAIFGGFALMMLLGGIGSLLGLFPFWMAAFDREKRALHDRICATRVVRKFDA